jgi:hypothetical protein
VDAFVKRDALFLLPSSERWRYLETAEVRKNGDAIEPRKRLTGGTTVPERM